MPPAQCREYEPASSREAVTQSAEISPLSPAQAQSLQSDASGARAPRQRSPTAERRQCRCDHFPPLPLRAADSRHRQEPSAHFVRWFARDQARRKKFRNRKSPMLISAQRWTPESQLRRGQKAVRLLDMDSADPGCSSYGFREYATPEQRDRWERQYMD